MAGGGSNDYGIQRAWASPLFGISEGKGGRGVKIRKPSMVWYGYYLELPI